MVSPCGGGVKFPICGLRIVYYETNAPLIISVLQIILIDGQYSIIPQNGPPTGHT